MGDSKDADPKDVERLRQLAVETPGILGDAVSGSESTRRQLIEKISYGSTQAVMLAEGDKLKQELGYAAAPVPLTSRVAPVLGLRSAAQLAPAVRGS